jgi:hypothetical protein
MPRGGVSILPIRTTENMRLSRPGKLLESSSVGLKFMAKMRVA